MSLGKAWAACTDFPPVLFLPFVAKQLHISTALKAF
jgi:hypothetical protein